jgi:hypothetical protein
VPAIGSERVSRAGIDFPSSCASQENGCCRLHMLWWRVGFLANRTRLAAPRDDAEDILHNVCAEARQCKQ